MVSHAGQVHGKLVLELVPRGRIDWEEGDEEWARIIASDGHVVALICVRVPLGIVADSLNRHEPALPDCLPWIPVNSFSEPDYAVARALIETVFERPVSGNVNWNRLSIEDLWWATV